MKIDLPNFNLKPGDFCNFCSSYSNPESSISTQTLHLSYLRSTSLSQWFLMGRGSRVTKKTQKHNTNLHLLLSKTFPT